MNDENKNINSSDPQVIVVETNTNNDSVGEEQPNTAVQQGGKAPKEKKHKNGTLKNFLKSRKARHGTISVAIIAVVIAIVVVLNVIMGILSNKFPDMAIDLTKNNSFALQSDTLDYVTHLKKDVNVHVLMSKSDFEKQGNYFIQSEHLLDKMQSNSKGKLKLDYVDLTKDPTFTSKYSNVDWSSSTGNYVILVESGDQYKALPLSDCFEYDESAVQSSGYNFTGTKVEQAVITAILNVTTENKVVVNMIKGNQEQDYSTIKSLLENNAYSVNEVSLATNGLDSKASIAILFAPSVDLDQSAIDKMSEWLNNDGKYGRSVIYVPTADKVDTPNIDSFLKEWGMQVDSGYVFETDTDYLISSSNYAFTVNYTDYYKDNLKNSNIPVIVTNAHDIKITDSGMAHGILTTSKSTGVQPYEPDSSWNYKDAIQNKALNVAAEGIKTNSSEKSAHVIVYGSYSMFSSQIMSLNSFNNSAFFMNTINTISDKDDTGITIESKTMDSGELGLTDVTTMNFMLVIFVIIIPIGVLVTGIVLWLRRRNR